MSLSKFEVFSKVKPDKIASAFAIADDDMKAALDKVAGMLAKIHDSDESGKKEKPAKRKLFEMKQTDVDEVIKKSLLAFCEETDSGKNSKVLMHAFKLSF